MFHGEHPPLKARILALVNQKGGVGKTTTAVNLGAALATLEKRVLVVDLDPQANTTSGLGLPKRSDGTTSYELLRGEAPAPHATAFPNLFLVPSSRDLVGAEIELVGEPEREFRLARALSPHRGEFDYILVDCPPSLGLLTVNALCAADAVLIPIQCEYYALEGVSDLLDTIGRVREGLNPGLGIEGVVLTMYDERTNLSRQVAADIRGHFGSTVYDTLIPRSVRLAEAPSFGKPILAYDVKSRGSEAYLKLAGEVLSR
jgi:chromosome partitioning protein